MIEPHHLGLAAKELWPDRNYSVLRREGKVKILFDDEPEEVDAPPELLALAEEKAKPKPVVRRFSKRKLFGAMSDEQYAVFENYETRQNKRKRRVFVESTELAEDDPDWPEFLGLMHTAYGPEETERLLTAAQL